MDSNYLLAGLKGFAELVYGQHRIPFCFSEYDAENDYYTFGFRKGKNEVINVVSKPTAIALTCWNFQFIKYLEKEYDVKELVYAYMDYLSSQRKKTQITKPIKRTKFK